MNKRLVILLLLIVELVIFGGFLAVFLEPSSQSPFTFVRTRTVVTFFIYGAIVCANTTVCYVILYVSETRRWYDFLLVLIGLFEMFGALLLGILNMTSYWHNVPWRVYLAITALSIGCFTFSSYCPLIGFYLKAYRDYKNISGKLPTKVIITPVVVAAIFSFGIAFVWNGYHSVQDLVWLHILDSGVAYIIPTIMSLAFMVMIKINLRNSDEESSEGYKIFAFLAALFIIFFGPALIGNIVYVHSGFDVFASYIGHYYFYAISRSLILLKMLLNLPLLLVVDENFQQGFFKLLGRRCHCCLNSSMEGGNEEPSVSYTVHVDD